MPTLGGALCEANAAARPRCRGSTEPRAAAQQVKHAARRSALAPFRKLREKSSLGLVSLFHVCLDCLAMSWFPRVIFGSMCGGRGNTVRHYRRGSTSDEVSAKQQREETGCRAGAVPLEVAAISVFGAGPFASPCQALSSTAVDSDCVWQNGCAPRAAAAARNTAQTWTTTPLRRRAKIGRTPKTP